MHGVTMKFKQVVYKMHISVTPYTS